MTNEMECKNSRRQCRIEEIIDCSHSEERIYRYHSDMKRNESGWSVVVQKVVGEMLNCRWKVLLGNAVTMI